MLTIKSTLPQDRRQAGTLEADSDGERVIGPASCRGKSDSQAAAALGNPDHIPTRRLGDHPYGGYLVLAVVRSHGPAELDKFGPAFLKLDPVSGDAEVGKLNKRIGIGIHGGPLADDGSLRATDGCLRVDNETAQALADLVEPELAAGRKVFYDCEAPS